MKKSLIAILALILVMGFFGNVFAADNPFDDVPKNHWAYEAVNKLAKDGLVIGDKGAFNGDQTITRYEMAVIVAKALAKADNADEKNKVLIRKLSEEFAGELKTLGAQVSALEEQINKLTFNGAATFKYQRNSSRDPMVVPANGKQNIDMNVNFLLLSQYHIGEWSVVNESRYNRDLRYPMNRPDYTESNDQAGISGLAEKIFATGPIGKATVTFGVYNYTGAYGLLYDNQAPNNRADGVSGLQIAFGDTVKTTLNYGKISHNLGIQNRNQWGMLMVNYFDDSRIDEEKLALYPKAGDDPRYFGMDVATPINRNTNAKAAYHHVYTASGPSANYLEAGFDAKFGQDVAFKVVAGKSSFTRQNKAYLVGLNYKGTGDNTKVGDYGAWVNYIKSETNATIDGGYDIQDKVNGAKGWEVGFSYVPYKQMLITTKYLNVKGTANTSFSDNVFRTQLEFFF